MSAASGVSGKAPRTTISPREEGAAFTVLPTLPFVSSQAARAGESAPFGLPSRHPSTPGFFPSASTTAATLNHGTTFHSCRYLAQHPGIALVEVSPCRCGQVIAGRPLRESSHRGGCGRTHPPDPTHTPATMTSGPPPGAALVPATSVAAEISSSSLGAAKLASRLIQSESQYSA